MKIHFTPRVRNKLAAKVYRYSYFAVDRIQFNSLFDSNNTRLWQFRRILELCFTQPINRVKK